MIPNKKLNIAPAKIAGPSTSSGIPPTKPISKVAKKTAEPNKKADKTIDTIEKALAVFNIFLSYLMDMIIR